MKRKMIAPAVWLVFLGELAGPVSAQSSSLYIRQEPAAAAADAAADVPGAGQLSSAIAANSFTAVSIPEPRQFAEHDLVTIIIRESFETNLKSILKSEKGIDFSAEITAIPELAKLPELVVTPQTFPNGNPKVGLQVTNDLDGKGRYLRTESMTGRITAQIADVKPNGTLVLEARQSIANDEEIQEIVLTGTCRASDITADNTVLSTELYDLHLDKQHEGELKKTIRKGFLTKMLERVFNF